MTRDERRAMLIEKHRAVADRCRETARPGDHDQIVAAIRKTNLQYAWLYRWVPRGLTKSVTVTVHDGCTPFTMVLPEGTQGWYHCEIHTDYDKYVRVDDMDIPAPGARVKRTTYYHSWACLVECRGAMVVAEVMRSLSQKGDPRSGAGQKDIRSKIRPEHLDKMKGA